MPVLKSTAIAAGYLALLMLATHIPLPDAAQKSLVYIDKPLHLLAYLILASVLAAIPVGPITWRIFGAAVLCLGIAVVDEFTQGIIPSRNSDRLDFVADCVGISLGLGITIVRERSQRRRAAS